MYNKGNVFSKIVQGEIPADKIYEDDKTLVFKNISPRAKTHLLAIPKGEYENFSDFYENSSDEEKLAWLASIAKATKGLDGGFRIVINNGEFAGQSVPHLHAHIVGGEKLDDCGM